MLVPAVASLGASGSSLSGDRSVMMTDAKGLDFRVKLPRDLSSIFARSACFVTSTKISSSCGRSSPLVFWVSAGFTGLAGVDPGAAGGAFEGGGGWVSSVLGGA